jgi:hypothetical protein
VEGRGFSRAVRGQNKERGFSPQQPCHPEPINDLLSLSSKKHLVILSVAKDLLFLTVILTAAGVPDGPGFGPVGWKPTTFR